MGLIIKLEVIDVLITGKDKQVTERVEKLEKLLDSIDQTLQTIFNRVNKKAIVTFTKLKAVAKIVYNICDKVIQLKGKQAIDYTNVLSLIKEL